MVVNNCADEVGQEAWDRTDLKYSHPSQFLTSNW
jgi:hypothetical protein